MVEFERTRGLCPQCLIDVPAEIFEGDGRIWIQQHCPRHANDRTLLAGDASEYIRLRQYVPDRSTGCRGVGQTCSADGPPTCVLLLEITLACNLRCPTCYADAQGHEFMDLIQARRRLLMISGGEPTIHPRFDEMLDPIERILINTNGLRIAQSHGALETIAKRRDRVELFVSLSSFGPAVHERLYGRDLREVKTNALDRAAAEGVFATLVPTLERGVNDDEIGDLYRFALSRKNVNGINFQPVMHNGRYEHDFAPSERLTLTDVIAAIESQTHGQLVKSDFVGLPCSHPDCCALYGPVRR
jgi:uncharacterized radical SAM superfamily Fe-S cluster-containing enzyme